MELFANKLKFNNFPQNGPYVKKQTNFGCNIQHMKIKLPKAHTSDKRQFCTREKIRQSTPIKAPSTENPLSIALN